MLSPNFIVDNERVLWTSFPFLSLGSGILHRSQSFHLYWSSSSFNDSTVSLYKDWLIQQGLD